VRRKTIARLTARAADGMIPKIHTAVEGYQLRLTGDYRAGPDQIPTRL